MPKQTLDTKVTVPARNTQTAIWVATTVVFAALFFLSSILDMKVKVTFGATSTAPTAANGVVRTTTPAPAGGIASQVGGC